MLQAFNGLFIKRALNASKGQTSKRKACGGEKGEKLPPEIRPSEWNGPWPPKSKIIKGDRLYQMALKEGSKDDADLGCAFKTA